MILWVRAVGCHGKPRDALPEDSTFVGRCGILALCCGCSYPGLTNSGPPHSPAVAIVYPKVPSSSGAYVYVPGKIRLPHTWRKNLSRFNKSVEEFLLQKAVFFYLQTNPFFFMSGDRMRIANTASQEITFKCSPIWFRVSFMYREQLSTQLLLTQKSPKERTKGRGIKMKFAVLWLQKSKFPFQIIFLIQFYWKKGMTLINIFSFCEQGTPYCARVSWLYKSNFSTCCPSVLGKRLFQAEKTYRTPLWESSFSTWCCQVFYVSLCLAAVAILCSSTLFREGIVFLLYASAVLSGLVWYL